MTSPDRGPNPIASLEDLGRAECLDLLATAAVGRVGLLVDGRPEVLPVNYALDGETVLFRTAEGTAIPLPLAGHRDGGHRLLGRRTGAGEAPRPRLVSAVARRARG